jgi:large subunit ribosomal protein L14e
MSDITLGQIVHSKAGRDKDKYFVIVGIVDDEYVLIADGNYRKVLNPKKKKVKHLVMHDILIETIKTKIMDKISLNDSELNKCLQSIVVDKFN